MLYMHIGINHSQKKDFFGVVIDDTWSVRLFGNFLTVARLPPVKRKCLIRHYSGTTDWLSPVA